MGQAFVFILLLFVATSITVPLKGNGKRIKREEELSGNTTVPFNGCVLLNQTYERGQNVPNLSPCEVCECKGPDIVCLMTKCQHNSGCRTIQQSGQCCPEYKCDCEHNGNIYNNGERLDKPEDPCQVCYCKGGEIMCTSITCYERDDCKPHYTAGQCCPKYDHCPLETNRSSGNSVRSVNTSIYSPKREMQPWPLTKSSNSYSTASYEDTSSSPNVYPQTIRIVEILPTTPDNINKPSEISSVPRIKTNGHTESRETEEMSKMVSSTEVSPEYSSSASEVESLLITTPETADVKNKTSGETNTESAEGTKNVSIEEVKTESGEDTKNGSIEEIKTESAEEANDNEEIKTESLEEVQTDSTEEIVVPQTESPAEAKKGSTVDLKREKEVKNNSTEEAHDQISSTLNPLAEIVDTNALADSLHQSTAHPNQYNTEESSNSVEEEATTWTVTEGSGYDILTGGVFEEFSTISTQQNTETSDIDSAQTSTVDYNKLELKDEPQDNASFEEYSTISPIREREFDVNISEDVMECPECNTSAFRESPPTSGGSSEKEVLESIENSSESASVENNNITETDSMSNESIFVEDVSILPKQNTSSERSVVYDEMQNEDLPSTTDSVMSTTELYMEKITTDEPVTDVVTTDNTEILTHSENTEASEIYNLRQLPDKSTNEQLTETRRSSAGHYRNLDDVSYLEFFDSKDLMRSQSYSANFEEVDKSSSPLLFPPVLNVHTLDYSEITPQKENITSHNTSSMAKVGIYHPTKPKESATFLTIMNENNNASTASVESVTSHMLLTPDDLKKLAEILIQEKIKPADLESSAKKNSSDSIENENSSVLTSKKNHKLSTASYRSVSENDSDASTFDSFSSKVTSNGDDYSDTTMMVGSNEEPSKNAYLNDEPIETSSTIADEHTTVTHISSTEPEKPKEVTSSTDQSSKSFISTVSGNTIKIEELQGDDPNVSRQIRITERGGNQYSTLLDERDLILLENFFKKNMGLHK